MIPRIAAFAIVALILLCALAAARHWGEDKHPLLISSAQKEQPLRPHPQALFSPCPLTPRNVPGLKRTLA